MKFIAIALGSIFFASAAQAVLKLVAVSVETPMAVFKDHRLYLGGFLLMVAFAGWIVAASRIEFSRLIPMNALSLAISGVIGVWLFDETISKSMLFAYALIVVGVAILTFGKS